MGMTDAIKNWVMLSSVVVNSVQEWLVFEDQGIVFHVLIYSLRKYFC